MPGGGDIREIQFNHPTLGSATLFPKANEDNEYDYGGLRSDDDDEMVDGSGQMIDKINQKRWFFQIMISDDLNERQDMEKCIQLAGDAVLAEWIVTHNNGDVHGGTGKPVGDLRINTNQGTFTLKVAGGGTFDKI